MKILIIAHDVGSKEMGMLFRPYYIAQGLKARGHQVEIITASYSRVRRYNPKITNDCEMHLVEDIPYHWIKSLKFSGNTIQRAIGMLLFSFKLWWYAGFFAKKFKADSVIASSPHPLIIWGAARIAKLTGGNLFFEVRDIWPLSMHELSGMKKSHPFYILCQIAEDFAYKNSKKVISLLPNAFEHMKTRGLEKDRFVCIPNGFDENEFSLQKSISKDLLSKIENFRSLHPTIIGYAGAHSLANSLGPLVDAFNKLKNEPQFGLILIGDGSEKENLIKQAKDLNLQNVLFLDPVSKDQIPVIINYFDIAYIGLKKSPLFKYGISPNKLIDYMALQKPVLYAIDTDNDPVEASNCGVKVSSDNSTELTSAIIKMGLLPKNELLKMGKNGQDWVKSNLVYSVLLDKYEETLHLV